ncbi:hypothetical protein Patl1_12746 [Pistacia atlantica]|uniref:Uncharacterized protein n=1 Tax=Pistacia atlantica TaxID=434234 RepID=A0ACC1AXG4_9ROSI|nr:hypothetical protein Patl1_12746 [Pistacia atlantica]
MMSPKTSNATHMDNQVSEPNQLANVPLLLQPSYARSKSLLYDELRNFRISLKWCALDHSSRIGKFISYLTFLFLAIVVPLLGCFSIKVQSSAKADDPISFNKWVQFPESGLALLGFFTLSRFFSKYGLRQLLFLDGLQDDSLFVRRGYTRELDKGSIELDCVCVGVIFILRFEGFHKMFEGCESDAGVIFREHVRIRKQLSATSHRYRFFIIASLVVITVSQLGALILVLATKSEKSFFNSGDLVVCSAVELSGFFLCLLGAARITHRAQGIASIATRWHMTVTCASSGSDQWKEQTECRDSDSDSSDIFITVSSQDQSSFQTRQALVAYLQHNNGG